MDKLLHDIKKPLDKKEKIMKKYLMLFLLVFCLVLSGCASAKSKTGPAVATVDIGDIEPTIDINANVDAGLNTDEIMNKAE